jgi:AcrR family transcriptional regulator
MATNGLTPEISNRELLLDAALKEFSERGYAGARVDSIAQHAGLNVRLVYHYFGGKEGLYDEALAAVMSDLRNIVEGFPVIKMTVDEKSLRGLFSSFFSLMLERPQAAKLLVSEIIAGSERLFTLKARMPELFESVFDRAVELFRSFLGVDRQPDEDDKIWLLSLAGMTSFLAAGFPATELFLGKAFATPDRWEEAIYRAVRRIVGLEDK